MLRFIGWSERLETSESLIWVEPGCSLLGMFPEISESGNFFSILSSQGALQDEWRAESYDFYIWLDSSSEKPLLLSSSFIN